MERVGFATVSAWSAVEAPLSLLGAWRDDPGPLPQGETPRRLLRHADEHAVAACRAVLTAIAAGPRAVRQPTGVVSVTPSPAELASPAWGVVAASCGAGRLMGAASLAATRAAGAVGVSTHVVPQCSLHAAASLISVLLGLHGPHFGIGGGPEAFAEALPVAAATLGLVAPGAGLWLVLTGWDREPVLDDAARPRFDTGDPVLRAFAMALTPRTRAGTVELELAAEPQAGASAAPSGRAAVGAPDEIDIRLLAPEAMATVVESAEAGACRVIRLPGRMRATFRPSISTPSIGGRGG